ncbi:MAG: hypothetical protein A2W52_00415 [Candidatus Taylorbacteria bacterium RIFCSPHIGHO2_02_49_25]|uniref:Uncharacterized protein n=1 Tax=Candidatus Taylorbacteria bacterium RIFCSPHIGHO2_02_49_25 TaxID=1802305 RepID=A0A1G2MIS7_9BACT|nr:MAG: hypothetical protein A2759_03755 [Candidatus Taylorbacteria bacterium RIFCSPHIGHO2_01_FULL_49_60]OHA23059.1 MAG: hypothetical protein A2W52_00415 [Candidatus Taylorbacteria bacterium RIFCSPHIGHO2_02_49_25]OHA35312.1 MAG: hypothetical protein A3B27_03525 [Candidatus Taylorbacteria bacterium RIFCSPLOWO2_01_FULL_50_130]OHA36396.1 MAG: hypothetical protein A2W65_02750 [Candidatus Taylorbacteria bacterium RIFCSPLOWO2_02_50_13]OHA41193.1 MAG: hypothetical protein A3H73_02965 [Candidatus Taylo
MRLTFYPPAGTNKKRFLSAYKKPQSNALTAFPVCPLRGESEGACDTILAIGKRKSVENKRIRTYAFASQFSLCKESTRLTFQKKLGGGGILWLYSESEILRPSDTSFRKGGIRTKRVSSTGVSFSFLL